MSGRVLVVTYFFPPLGGIGVQRTLKYITYLPRWGWQPSVITPRNPAYTVRDPSLLAVLPADLEVNRTASFEPGRLPNAVARLLSRRPTDSEGAATDLAGRPTRFGLAGRLIWKSMILWNRIWNVLLFPDTQVGWVPFGWRAGRKAYRRRRFDVVYSTAAPVSAHLVAGLVKRSTHRPWVADFRDPWIGNPFAAPLRGPKGWLQRRMERWIAARADRVVLVVDELREMFVERYPDLADKFVYIPNGYDRADLVGLTPARRDPGRFTILFAGTLYRPGELDAFLGGVERLVTRRPDLRTRLRVQFVGNMSPDNRHLADLYLAPDRMADVVSFEDFVPRREAFARMAGADALLQLMSDGPGTSMFVGGKLFEYMAFDRPILAVMPPGEGRRLVESLPSGRAADVEPGSVADVLERLLDDPPAPGPTDPKGRYDRVNLA
ncbi:MAG: glycosyltransferase family 4 protein, partial [Candidatus Limnocylindrales bacterium]